MVQPTATLKPHVRTSLTIWLVRVRITSKLGSCRALPHLRSRSLSPRRWPPPLPPAMPARFRFLIINWSNLSCPGMGSCIATTTNDDEDYVEVDVNEVGPKAIRRSRSHADFLGRYISTHSSTNSVDEEDNFLSYP
jgi:hypothetical protein